MNIPNFLVDVRCFTFNQSEYITDTMNGFCMQKNMRKTITADRPIDLKTLQITSVNQVKFKQKGREE